MNRRQVVVGAGGVAAVAGGAVYVTRSTLRDDDSADPDTGEADDGGSPEPPFEIRTIDALGSEGGTIIVPDPERLTVLNFTRTRCPTSAGYLSNLAEARESVDGDVVRFVSVLERGRDPADTDEEFAEWWAEHDGEWTLAVDDGHVVEYYEGTNTPTTVIVDGEGTVHWAEGGTPRPSVIVDEIDAALDSGTGEA